MKRREINNDGNHGVCVCLCVLMRGNQKEKKWQTRKKNQNQMCNANREIANENKVNCKTGIRNTTKGGAL